MISSISFDLADAAPVTPSILLDDRWLAPLELPVSLIVRSGLRQPSDAPLPQSPSDDSIHRFQSAMAEESPDRHQSPLIFDIQRTIVERFVPRETGAAPRETGSFPIETTHVQRETGAAPQEPAARVSQGNFNANAANVVAEAE